MTSDQYKGSTDLVQRGYDRAATTYLRERDQFKSHPYLEKLVALLSPGATVLDLGCGAGRPVDAFLVKRGCSVVGIDLSRRQIELARRNIPAARYEVRSMAELVEGEYNAEAVVSFYAIFHTPRETHADLFRLINSFLPVGGPLLVTMGADAWEGTETFCGVEMYWSHYGATENRAMVEAAGFRVLLDVIDTSGGERHQVLLATKVADPDDRNAREPNRVPGSGGEDER
jgi:cyclopropane fatty-acyl-phospholipid synthase-like methyltransferase